MDGSLHEALRFKVNAVVEAYELPDADREELLQGLWVEFGRAFKRYKPSLSKPSTYARRVADLWLRERARSFGQQGRRRIFQAEEWSIEHADARRGDDSSAAQDARYDFESICALLEPEDAELLGELRYSTVAEVAERRGLDRGTVYRRKDRIFDFLRRRAEYFEK
jgi:RNA polymerase sigma factor (sigma-70 family)